VTARGGQVTARRSGDHQRRRQEANNNNNNNNKGIIIRSDRQTCTRFKPSMQLFTALISFTLSTAVSSVSFTVNIVFSFFTGRSSSSSAACGTQTSWFTGSNGSYTNQLVYWEQHKPVGLLGAIRTSWFTGSNTNQLVYWEQWELHEPVGLLGAVGATRAANRRSDGPQRTPTDYHHYSSKLVVLSTDSILCVFSSVI